MSLVNLNALSLKCPQPLFKIAARSTYLKAGDILEVVADCPTFEQDISQWCARMKKTLLWIKKEDDGKKRCQILF